MVVVDTDNSVGSGSVIKSTEDTAYVLTCAHVIDGETGLKIIARSGEKFPAEAVKMDLEHDLALLRVHTPRRLPSLPFARGWELYQRVWAIGAPAAEPGQLSEGFLTSFTDKNPGCPKQEYWRITGAFIFMGISGGAIVNTQGELICVPSNVRTYSGQVLTQHGYCVGMHDVLDFLKDTGVVPRYRHHAHHT
jgi:serine protease Do